MKKVALITFIYVVFFSVLFLYLSSFFTSKVSSIQSPNAYVYVLNENILWSLIQDWRVKNNLEPYIKDQRLCKIALERSIEQCKLGFLDNHKGFLARYSSYPFRIAENALAFYPNESEALNGWLNSPKHLSILKKSYSHSCLKCLNGYCSQIFSSFKP